jgi:thiol-disulfide isomerase/thioredoxin
MQESIIIPVDEQELMTHIQQSPKDYVVVNFYATWCKPCIKELPELVDLKNNPESQTDVLLVSVDEDKAKDQSLGKFLQKMEVNFPSFHLSPDSLEPLVAKVYPEWNTTIPLNFVYTKEGRLVEATGMTDQQEILMIIHEDQVFSN